MENRKGFIQWIKEHKKELLIAGISIGTLASIVWLIKNRDETHNLWDALKLIPKLSQEGVAEVASKETLKCPLEPIQSAHMEIDVASSQPDSFLFEVSPHIRTLPEGWHASPEKIEKALENNIILLDGQTWVDSYIKGKVAA